MIYGLAEIIQDNKVVQIKRDRNSLLQMFRDMIKLEEITVSDCFRLGKEQPHKSGPFVFFISSPWHHKIIFFVIEKGKNSNMYIKEFMNFADYQNERKFLKCNYELSSLMQKEKSEFKIKAGSLVFGTYTIDCNKQLQSECGRILDKGNSSS